MSVLTRGLRHVVVPMTKARRLERMSSAATTMSPSTLFPSTRVSVGACSWILSGHVTTRIQRQKPYQAQYLMGQQYHVRCIGAVSVLANHLAVYS
jgi:hypothetical protein